MTTSADVAVRRALAAHLRTRLSLSTSACQPDWFPATQALPRPVAVSVHAAGSEGFSSAGGDPVLVSITPVPDSDPPTAVALYRTAEYLLPVAIDVWASSEAERDEWKRRIEDALNEPVTVGGQPVSNVSDGLTLVCSPDDYHSAVVTFDLEDVTALATSDESQREEWRVVFALSARVDKLTEKTIPRQVTTQVVIASGATVDPADPDLSGADTVTVSP